jgi:hypothetical protein
MNSRWRSTAWLVSTGLTTLLLSCGAPTVTTSNAFSQEHAVVQSWWAKEESAFMSGDPQALGDLYDGVALEVAEGQMTIEKLKGTRPKYPRPFRGAIIFAPSAGSNPAWFLAIVQYAPIDQDGRAQPITMTFPGVLFTTASGSWKAAEADVQAPIPHSALGNADTTVSTPLGDNHYIMAAPGVAESYNAYLNALSASQPTEVPFATGPTSFAAEVTRISWPPSSIATARLTFEVETPEVAAYAITSGLIQVPEVVLFVLRRTVVIKPRQGCLVRLATDIEWSGIVPPGSYTAVTLTSVSVVAASVPLNDGDASQGRKVIDISGSADDVTAAGIKC